MPRRAEAISRGPEPFLKSIFLDTSALTAILFEESGSSELLTVLSGVENLFASNLLEAEIRSAASREGLEPQAVDRALLKVKWIHPDRALTQEIKQIISHGVYLRGADLAPRLRALFRGQSCGPPIFDPRRNPGPSGPPFGLSSLAGGRVGRTLPLGITRPLFNETLARETWKKEIQIPSLNRLPKLRLPG